ncbi:MAG: nucleotide sugar dehydrogenase [Candidatus Baldrarchaeia archaeon]
MIEKLANIRNRSAHIAILGSGYVGLPTAALFADVGFHVTAIDIKPEVVKTVNRGISPINEPGLNKLVSRNVQASRLKATLNSTEALTQADTVIISVQTPINKNKKPDLSFLKKALEEVGKTIKKGTLVVITSTVPPGTTLLKVKPKLEILSGLKADADFFLAYVPERIAPGKALKEFVESPRLIGGIGPNSTKVTAELFRTVCKKVIETDVATAEVAKLAENTFRDVNIAFANQLALICEQQGVDVKKVIELANTHPRVNIHTPGPGVGGPCLPKDPYLLTHKTKITKPNLIRTARQINDYMPGHIVKMTLQALKNVGKNIEKSEITVLGTAYKANIDDSRLSPSKPIIRKLLNLGAKVVAYDPYCPESFNAEKTESLVEAVKGSDCIIVVTDHPEFKEIDLSELRKSMRDNPIIVDGRRLIEPAEAKKIGFIYYGVGYSGAVARRY